jgi:hypothetical protein
MASTINASTAGGGGIISTADSSGVLQLQTAGTTAITVDASQKVGVGTASPVSLLQVGSVSTSNTALTVASTNNTAAQINLLGDLDATFGTNLKYEGNGNFFAVSLNNAGTLTERMRIDSNGNVLVGTTTNASSAAKIIVSSTAPQMAVDGNGAGVNSLINWTTSGTTKAQTFFDATNTRFYIACNNSGGVYLASGGTSWTSASDERVKDIIEPITDAANKVSTLRAVIGKYKTDKEGTRRSFLIAQDVQSILPEAVDATNPENLGVQYTDVIPLLVASIKELKAIIDTQAEQIKALQGAQ